MSGVGRAGGEVDVGVKRESLLRASECVCWVRNVHEVPGVLRVAVEGRDWHAGDGMHLVLVLLDCSDNDPSVRRSTLPAGRDECCPFVPDSD